MSNHKSKAATTKENEAGKTKENAVENDSRNRLRKWRKDNPGVIPVKRSLWKKLRENPTRKIAIDVYCHHCMGWEEGKPRPAGITDLIRECTVPDCPLYGFRPYKQKE